MKKVDKKILSTFCWVLFLLFLLAPVNSFAGLLRLESENFMSVRNGDDLKMELPMYEFLGTSYSTNNQSLQFNGNIGFFEDPLKNKDDFFLYLLDVSYTPIPDLFKIKVGRFLNIYRSIDSTSTDSLGGEFYFFEKRLTLGGLWGVERELELGNFSGQNAKIAGVYSFFRTSDMFPYSLYLKYLNRNYSNPANPIENVIQNGLHKAFPGFWNPEVFYDSEVDVTKPSHLKRLEVGTDLYPAIDTAWRLRGLTYDFTAQEGIEQPIFSIFSQGRLYEVSTQLEYMFTKNFVSGVGFAYDNYLLQEPKRTNGYMVEFDTKYFGDSLDAFNSFFYFQSYGGDVFGDRIKLLYKLTDAVRLKGIVEYDYYKKVTSSKRFAFNAEAGVDFWFWDRFKLYLGGEFNSNNALKYDARFIGKLTYLLWSDV